MKFGSAGGNKIDLSGLIDSMDRGEVNVFWLIISRMARKTYIKDSRSLKNENKIHVVVVDKVPKLEFLGFFIITMKFLNYRA
jgi:hypothetical protein